jgi:hypothetical protein
MDREKGLCVAGWPEQEVGRDATGQQAHARRRDAQEAKSLGSIQAVTRS